MAKGSAEVSITAQNTFTGSVKITGVGNISISGTFVATWTLQRSFDDGVTWKDVPLPSDVGDTGEEERTFDAPENGVLWRLGVKTGNFTSGTVVCRISF